MEERKLREIEHSRVRREIVRGNERSSDTNSHEEAPNLDHMIKDKAAFQRHFSNTKFYSVTLSSEEYVRDWLKARCGRNTRALDYCCGNGEFALYMGESGADTCGVDISYEGVRNARDEARRMRIEGSRFQVMDAENLAFKDDSFDVIVEWGALHHLDYDGALRELARVLRPNGEIVCIEALRHNPFIHLYRKLTMHLRTEWEVQHILTVGQLKTARNYFNSVDGRFCHLFVLLAVPFRKSRVFKRVREFLDRVDGLILRIPWIRRYAWIVIFTLGQPKDPRP